jgi:hypothetical protein
VRYLTGPWRLAVARVAATREATAASVTGAPTAARLAAAGGREDGGRRRRRRRWEQDDGIQNTFQPADSCGLYEPSAMALDVRHMQLPIRPSSAPATG